jgi:exonuclease SbcD
VRYAGSPLKYSVSEVHHRKSVSMVHLDAHGQLSIEEIPVLSPRDLCIVKGEIKQAVFIPDETENIPHPDDFVHVKLHNRELQANPMSIIRQRYPYAIGMEWVTAPFQDKEAQLKAHEVQGLSETELFARFYQEFTQNPLDDAKFRILQEVIQEIQHT